MSLDKIAEKYAESTEEQKEDISREAMRDEDLLEERDMNEYDGDWEARSRSSSTDE